MIRRDGPAPPERRPSALAGGVLLLLALAVIVALTIEACNRLTVLAVANTESAQRALAQPEVELARLLAQLGHRPVSLDQIRQHFHAAAAQIETLHDSPQFRDLRALPGFAEPLAAIDKVLARALPVVDGPDTDLLAALPRLDAELTDLQQSVQRMSRAGADFLAAQSDARRLGVAATLRWLATVVAALVAALLGLLAALLRVNARSRRHAADSRLTGARLASIVSTSADAIVVADRAGRVLEVNPAAETMFGYSRTVLLGTPVTDLVLPPETREADIVRIDALLDPARGGGKTGARLEVEVMRRDQSRFPAEVSVAAADSTGGEIIIAFVRDISDRRTAEHDLIAALDRARGGERAKAEFLTVMSHEMRTPLNGLLGSTEILAGTALDPRQRELVDVIMTSGHVLLHHVNGVLDLSRAEAGAVASPDIVFDIESLVAEVAANQRGLAVASGTRIAVVNVGAAVGRVRGNPGQLRQILLNLVGNAVKFTRDGSVTVEIEPLTLARDGCTIEFRVIDSGIGIAETDLGRVFEDFVRLDTSYGRETGGTGLGLGITRRLVQALGGEIDATSLPGSGSRFRVRLTFGLEPEAAAAPPESPAAAVRGIITTVLIVDDNAINRFVLRHLLEEVGLSVTDAGDGAEGVALAETRAFDLILMDISMPGMDGLEAAHRIRSGTGLSRDARIVAVTAHAQPDERQRFRAAGMEDCLVKPITRGMLTMLLSGDEPAGPGVATLVDLPVDAAILGDLVAQLGAGPARALIGRFLEEGDRTMARLSAGLPDAEARTLCHRFAGSAATFGAMALAARLSAAETALGAGLPVPGGVSALGALWADSRARIAGLTSGTARAAE